jgi:hypothetical protein
MIDTEILGLLVVAAFVLAKLWEIIKERLAFWARLPDWGREVGGYVIIIANGALIWLTGLDALPGFNAAGRVLTCVIGALGPSAVYDVLFDKPKPHTVDYDNVPEM